MKIKMLERFSGTDNFPEPRKATPRDVDEFIVDSQADSAARKRALTLPNRKPARVFVDGDVTITLQGTDSWIYDGENDRKAYITLGFGNYSGDVTTVNLSDAEDVFYDLITDYEGGTPVRQLYIDYFV